MAQVVSEGTLSSAKATESCLVPAPGTMITGFAQSDDKDADNGPEPVVSSNSPGTAITTH